MTERLAFNAGARRQVASAYAFPEAARPEAAAADAKPAAGSRAHAETEKRDWAFTWTLAFSAILFLRPQDVFPPLEALHLAELSALAALISLVTGRLARQQSVVRMTPELAGVLAFGGVILLTAPFSIWFGGAVSVFTEQYLKVTLVYLLAANVLTSPRRLERLTWVLVTSIGYIAFRAVLDYVRGDNLIAAGTRVQGTVGGLVQNPNDLALHMVVFLPLALFTALRPGSTIKRLVAGGAGAFMMGAIVASGSRGGFMGFAAMLIVLAAFVARQRPGMVLVGAFALICALPIVPGGYWRRIASITDSSKDDYQSSTARKNLMTEGVRAFMENPITGVGAGRFKDYKPESRMEAWQETHNVWLQVASELGIFGLTVFGYLVFRAFSGVRATRRLLARVRTAAAAARRNRPAPKNVPVVAEDDALLFDAHSAAMAASLVGFLVCSFFASVAYTWTFYYLLALAVTPRDILRGRIAAPPRRAALRTTAAAARPAVGPLRPDGARV